MKRTNLGRWAFPALLLLAGWGRCGSYRFTIEQAAARLEAAGYVVRTDPVPGATPLGCRTATDPAGDVEVCLHAFDDERAAERYLRTAPAPTDHRRVARRGRVVLVLWGDGDLARAEVLLTGDP